MYLNIYVYNISNNSYETETQFSYIFTMILGSIYNDAIFQNKKKLRLKEDTNVFTNLAAFWTLYFRDFNGSFITHAPGLVTQACPTLCDPMDCM